MYVLADAMKNLIRNKGSSVLVAGIILAIITSVVVILINKKNSDTAIVDDLRTHMDSLTAEARFSGAVLLAKDGKPLFQEAYGFANQAFNAKNNVDTKFNLASIGKLFTSVAIMQLIEEGRISIDDTLIEVMPDYPNKADAEKITIRHLLMHQSGLGGIGNPDDLNHSKLHTLRDYLPIIVEQPLKFKPGQGKFYSNAGYLVLGLVIESITGQDYYDYVREHIFNPAGMKDTGYFSMYDDVPNLALGYTRLPIGGHPALVGNAPPRPVPFRSRGTSGGGVYSTLGDMLQFSEALRNNKILKKDSFELMVNGGYGPSTGTANGIRYIGHGGGTFGGSTYFEMYPDIGYVSVVLANSDGAADLVYERLRQQIVRADVPDSVRLSTDALKGFEGQYEAASPTTQREAIMGPITAGKRPISITADREGLWVDFGDGFMHRFLPLSDTEFFDRDTLGVARLTFTKDEKDQVTGINITGSGPIPTTTAKRLSP